MGKYLNDMRKKESSTSLRERLRLFKPSFDDDEVPELEGREVKVEYEEPSFFKRIFQWKRKKNLKREEEELDISEEERHELDDIESDIEALEDEESALEHMEEEVEIQREGLLTRLANKLNFFKRRKRENLDVEDFDESEYLDGSETSKMDEDVKEVLKIAHAWIDKLPPRYKKQFKSSEDFEKYKKILMKYDLVKEK